VDWGPILEQVIRTPIGYQRPVDDVYLRRLLRCSENDLDALLRAYNDGAPSTEMDAFDAWNAGLYSGSRRSRPELEMAYLSRLLAPGRDWTEPIDITLSIGAQCPEGDRCTSADWRRPRLDGAVWLSASETPSEARWTARVTRHGRTTRILSTTVSEVWREFLDSYHFHYNHPELEKSAEVTRSRRAASCVGLSAALAATLTERAVTARTSSGFLWGGLNARDHQWVEIVDDDGGWKPLDPSLGLLAHRFLASKVADFCFGSQPSLVLPMRDQMLPTAEHDCAGRVLELEVGVGRG
jgi:hypothetical protein